MPFEIDFTQWPVWAVLIALALFFFWKPLGKGLTTIIDAFRSKGESKRERQEIEAIGERQDEVALWSAMVNLQRQTIEQNKLLLDFVAETVTGELRDIAKSIKTEVGDVEKRWLAVFQQMEKSTAALTLMTMELTRLGDRLTEIEKQIEWLLGRCKGRSENDSTK